MEELRGLRATPSALFTHPLTVSVATILLRAEDTCSYAVLCNETLSNLRWTKGSVHITLGHGELASRH